jgi:hypothetical protein
MKVEVKQEHINRGWPGEPTGCPVFLAVQDKLPSVAEITSKYIYYWRRLSSSVRYEERFLLPSSAKKFIKKFDSGKQVEPFTFTIGED